MEGNRNSHLFGVNAAKRDARNDKTDISRSCVEMSDVSQTER